MKKILYIFTIILFTIGCDKSSDDVDNQKYYYWADKEKIELSIIGNKKFILITDTELKKLPNDDVKKEMKKLSPQDSPKIERLDNLRWGIIDSKIIKQYNVNTIYEADNYMTSLGKEVVLSHIFYVKLKREQDFHLLQKLAQKYNVLIFDKNEYMPLWNRLSCVDMSKGDALQIANIFYESGLFEASQPSFIEGNIALNKE